MRLSEFEAHYNKLLGNKPTLGMLGYSALRPLPRAMLRLGLLPALARTLVPLSADLRLKI